MPNSILADSYGRKFGACLVFFVAACTSTGSRSQDVAVKTNLVSDALLSPNAGVEVALAPKWSIDVSGQFNLWTVGDGHKWRHWLLQPEARYWFCQGFAGHFLGFHVLGGQYNVGNINMDFKFLGTDFSQLKNKRFEGWGAGAGLAYGYAWPLSRHWNLEAEFGFGWVWTCFDSFPCEECGRRIDHNKTLNAKLVKELFGLAADVA